MPMAPSHAQLRPLFDNSEYLEMVDRGGDFIYNGEFDSALMVIDSLALGLPNHPIVPMMKAMNFAWQDQPMRTTSPVYAQHEAELMKVIALSMKIQEKNPEDIEGMFFEMSARGLLAEYYAQEGSSFKAMSEAKQTYNLIKLTMEMTDQSSELLFLAGLYNYFREKYPERHPLYKSFVWIFRSGDIELGLSQLDRAVHESKIVKIEAALYLSYIWLRYENRADTASYYLERLHENYPSNKFFTAKYVECLALQEKFLETLPLIDELLTDEKAYYRMCGLIYQGYYYEIKMQDHREAKKYYQYGLDEGRKCLGQGEYYRSVAYLGLGRIAEGKGQLGLAEDYYEKTIDLDESDLLTIEAEHRLDNIN